MSLPQVLTPRRIPPVQSSTLPKRVSDGTKSPVCPAIRSHDPANLTKDAYSLQARLDDLARQLDQVKNGLRQSQKLASLGTAAAMIAHEMNNMLTPVVAYCREALDRQDVDLMRLALTKTLDRTAMMTAMIERVIGMARQSDCVIKAVKVRQVVEEALGCLGRDPAKDNIQILIQIDDQLVVRANPNQLLQVFFNMFTNARHAMLGRGGRLTIDATTVQDNHVEINVRDTGCGIAPEHLGAIFDPFFTTKASAERPDQRGLGLGLAITRDIIEDFGGSIDVASETGIGTTFTIILPVAE